MGRTERVTDLIGSSNKKESVAFNCASVDDDTKAESNLFGYLKGGFMAVDYDACGLFYEVEKKEVLFFDEIHNLSKLVQEKLMTPLKTVSKGTNIGKFRFWKVGSTKLEYSRFQPIFAPNSVLKEMKRKLFLDLFDHVDQLCVSFSKYGRTGLGQYAAFVAVISRLIPSYNQQLNITTMP